MTVGELRDLLEPHPSDWLVIMADYTAAPDDQGTWHLREASSPLTHPIGVTPIDGQCNDYDATEPGPDNAVLIAT